VVETREYTSVLEQMATITDYLKGSRDTLIQKYQQEQWIPITEHPDAGGLVTIALNRISTDARQYDVFIDMLKDITGMDIIVERIQGDRASGGTQPAASPQPEYLAERGEGLEPTGGHIRSDAPHDEPDEVPANTPSQERYFLLHEKRGLAILVTCDYEGIADITPLNATNHDANEMEKTFDQFEYDVHQLKNGGATAHAITTLLKQASDYLRQYSGSTTNSDGSPKVIVFAFSGHGTSCGWDDDVILSNDNQMLSLKEQILPPLVNHRLAAAIPKLFFIDACRGNAKFMSETLRKSTGVHLTYTPKMVDGYSISNYRIDYATIPNYTSEAGHYESVWMPELARQLRTRDKELVLVVDEVKAKITQGKYSQQPQSVDQLRGIVPPLKLYYKSAAAPQ
jgi:hypothetical protein